MRAGKEKREKEKMEKQKNPVSYSDGRDALGAPSRAIWKRECLAD